MLSSWRISHLTDNIQNNLFGTDINILCSGFWVLADSEFGALQVELASTARVLLDGFPRTKAQASLDAG